MQGFADKELIDIIVVSLTFLALLFNASAILDYRKVIKGMDSIKFSGFGIWNSDIKELVVSSIRNLYSAIRYGLFLCCILATIVVIQKTLPFVNFELSLLAFTSSEIELVIDLSRFLLLIWLGWLFYTSIVIAQILYCKRITFF